MQIICISLVLVLHISTAKQIPQTVIIETKYGKVEGDVIKVPEEDFVVVAFKGIPYGTAKRFQKPEPVKPWNDTLDARKWGARCHQHQITGLLEPLIAEDVNEQCLHLNVFAPFDKRDQLRPVMVFIHGGAFAFGSSTQYGQEGIVNWMVPKEVIVITINYRLGPWGFFSTGTKDAPGNYGLWDQTMALHWVKENIDRFGGDPNKVTIFGESAGGISVAVLALSPHSRDLFHQSIIMSGSSTMPWISPSDPNTMEVGEILSTTLQCGSLKTADTKALVECLKKKSDEEILEAMSSYRPFGKFKYVGFVPVFDGDFFPEPIEKLQASAPPKPVISGVVGDEKGAFTTATFSKLDLEWMLEDPDAFTVDDFNEKLHILLPEKTFGEWTPLVHSLAENHYINALGDRNNNSFVVGQYTKIFSDFMFGHPGYKEALERYQRGSKVWLYLFDYYDDALFPKDFKYKGAYHFYELAYMFKMLPIHHPSPFEGNDKKVKDVMTTLWTNFAIYGHPNPTQSPFHKDFAWEPISDQHPSRYLNIGLDSAQGELYNRKMVSFWHELLPKVMNLMRDKKTSGEKPTKTKTEL